MAHIREQIRERVVSLLSTSATLVSGRVYNTRLYPFTKGNLPAINVTTLSEQMPLMTMGRDVEKRTETTISLLIDCHVAVTDTFDDDLDAICTQVEEAIGGDFTINDLAKQALLDVIEIEIVGEGEKPVGVARMSYNVRHHPRMSNIDQSWILALGTWDDTGTWIDTATWNDGS